jgi:hypothetical protein
MYRAVLTAAAAAALVIIGALPAHAAPPPSPGEPTALQVTGTTTSATLSWGAPRERTKVTGYEVSISPASRQPGHGTHHLPASALTDTFTKLTEGTTYTFDVRALAGRASSRSVTVTYTTAKPAQASLFALNATGAVVRYPATGIGPGKVVTAAGAGYTVNKRGDVFVPSADLTSIVVYPGNGGPARVVATGLQLTADLRSDDAGNIYWAGGMLPSAKTLGTAPGTGTPPEPAGIAPGGPATAVNPLWAVGADGTIASVGGTLGRVGVSTTKDGVTTTRTLVTSPEQFVGFPLGVLVGPGGDVYINEKPSGGSGAQYWYLLKAGAMQQQAVSPRIGFDYAAVNSSAFFLLQSKEWCTSPAEYSGIGPGCTVDRSISDVRKVTVGGSATVAPVTGVTAGSRGLNISAADAAGDVFINIDKGPTPGLWRVPAGGGAAQQLSSGQFTRLLAS